MPLTPGGEHRLCSLLPAILSPTVTQLHCGSLAAVKHLAEAPVTSRMDHPLFRVFSPCLRACLPGRAALECATHLGFAVRAPADLERLGFLSPHWSGAYPWCHSCCMCACGSSKSQATDEISGRGQLGAQSRLTRLSCSTFQNPAINCWCSNIQIGKSP